MQQGRGDTDEGKHNNELMIMMGYATRNTCHNDDDGGKYKPKQVIMIVMGNENVKRLQWQLNAIGIAARAMY